MRVPPFPYPALKPAELLRSPAVRARCFFPQPDINRVGPKAFPMSREEVPRAADLRIDFAVMMASRSSSLNCCVNIFLVESGISRLSR